ncbi:unnamed protein product [Amoebophrya sp. A25]|nr:unnamed protein product [Amoebophrya sp. A25]|eukprot:GSA25T00004208001.1
MSLRSRTFRVRKNGIDEGPSSLDLFRGIGTPVRSGLAFAFCTSLCFFSIFIAFQSEGVIAQSNIEKIPQFVCHSNTTNSGGAPVLNDCNVLARDTNTQRYYGRFFENSAAATKGPVTRHTQIEIVFQARTRLTNYRLGCLPDGHPLRWYVYDEYGAQLDSRTEDRICDSTEKFEIANAGNHQPAERFFIEFTEVSVSLNLPNPPVSHVLQLAFIVVEVDKYYGLKPHPWGACSAECGGGTQRRDITCANVFNGEVRSAVICGVSGGDAALEGAREQACNTQPCACVGTCLEHAKRCAASSTNSAVLGCEKLFLKGSGGLVRLSWSGERHADAGSIATSGVLDSVAVAPYYTAPLLGSYSLAVADVSARTPSAWRLYAGPPDWEEKNVDILTTGPNGGPPPQHEVYTGLTLVDMRVNYGPASGKWRAATTEQAPLPRARQLRSNRDLSSLSDTIQYTVVDINSDAANKDKLTALLAASFPAAANRPAGLVIPTNDEIVDPNRWGFYRIEFLAVGDTTYNNAKMLQTHTYPAQVGFADFDLFNRGVAFGVELGAWSTCSKMCGGGTQTRTVKCKGSDGGTYPFRRCSDYDPTTQVKEQACNVAACPDPGQITSIAIQDVDRYDVLAMRVSISNPGGTLICAAYSEDPRSRAFPPEAASQVTAATDMSANALRKQRLSQACAPPTCEAQIKELPQNLTQRVYCGVEDIAGTLHIQYQRELRTLRGPVLQQLGAADGGSGCYRDHLVRRDLPTQMNATDKPDGNYHTEGECAYLCRDFHYFGLQMMGECRCGNNTVRKYGKGEYGKSMSGGCDCDGPIYGYNVQCVWEQVPPLIDSLSGSATRVYASKVKLGLWLNPQEFVHSGGQPTVKCTIVGSKSRVGASPTRRLLDEGAIDEAILALPSSSFEGDGAIMASATSRALLNDGNEKQLEGTRIHAPAGRAWQVKPPTHKTSHVDGRKLTTISSLARASALCLRSDQPCVVEFHPQQVPPNHEFAFECQEDSDLHEPRHIRYYSAQTSQIAIVFKPTFGVIDVDWGIGHVAVRNLDWRAIQYQCFAQPAGVSENQLGKNGRPLPVRGSDRAFCPTGQDCTANIRNLHHGATYDVFCELQTGTIKMKMAPQQGPYDAFAAKQYTLQNWYKDSAGMPQAAAAAPTATNPPPRPPVRMRSDEDPISGGFVAGMTFLGIFMVAVGWMTTSGCRGDHEELSFPETLTTRQRLLMSGFEFLQWYDFLSDAVLTKNLSRISGDGQTEFVNNMQHFAVVLLCWSSCIFGWSILRLGLYPMFVDNFGSRRFHVHYRGAREKKPECGSYLLFVFPASVFAPLMVSDAGTSFTAASGESRIHSGGGRDAEALWRAFHGKRFFRQSMSAVEDFGFTLVCLLLLASSDIDYDAGPLTSSDVAHSFSSSLLMLLFAHGILPALLHGSGPAQFLGLAGGALSGQAGDGTTARGLMMPRLEVRLPTGEGTQIRTELGAGAYAEHQDEDLPRSILKSNQQGGASGSSGTNNRNNQKIIDEVRAQMEENLKKQKSAASSTRSSSKKGPGDKGFFASRAAQQAPKKPQARTDIDFSSSSGTSSSSSSSAEEDMGRGRGGGRTVNTGGSPNRPGTSAFGLKTNRTLGVPDQKMQKVRQYSPGGGATTSSARGRADTGDRDQFMPISPSNTAGTTSTSPQKRNSWRAPGVMPASKKPPKLNFGANRPGD